jgi:hypothetical protein
MSIREVEQFDGDEIAEWRAHIARRPFTVDLLDFIGAHICQSIVKSFGGKHIPIEKFLLLEHLTKEQKAKRVEAAMRRAFGG